MPNKQAILENVDTYSSDDLVKLIKEGIVTFEELCEKTEGYFSASVRKEVERKLAGSEEEDWQMAKSSNSVEVLGHFILSYPSSIHKDEAQKLLKEIKMEREWEAVDKKSIESLRNFCEIYPDNIHCDEARKIIQQLTGEDEGGIEFLKDKIKAVETKKGITDKHQYIYEMVVKFLDQKRISHSDFLRLIEKDNNIFGSEVLSLFIDNGKLTFDELKEIGIDKCFISALNNEERPIKFPLPKGKLVKINKESFEVYFWGIPSSGKSCALGAILSVAGNGKVADSMMMDNDCTGYGYMNRLSSLFSTKNISVLPGGTDTRATYEMAFDLYDKDGYRHPLTCMDLAGELFRSMYLSDAGELIADSEEEKTLDILTNILINPETRSHNKKIHFFVMEYGAENRKYDGLKQDSYLNGALQYIKRTGIFKDDTVAIYIIITKVDKAHASSGQLGSVLRNYITKNYLGFYNGLVRICKDYEINDGKVDILPFSLGKVCFQDYCLFDEIPATNIVQKLLERTKGFKNGLWDRIKNKAKK